MTSYAAAMASKPRPGLLEALQTLANEASRVGMTLEEVRFGPDAYSLKHILNTVAGSVKVFAPRPLFKEERLYDE